MLKCKTKLLLQIPNKAMKIYKLGNNADTGVFKSKASYSFFLISLFQQICKHSFANSF